MIIDFCSIIDNGFNITGVFHIGAHYGQEANMYFQKNIPCILFEPNPDSFKVLKENCNNVMGITLENYALGNKNEKKLMYCEKNNQGMSSSLLKPKKHLEYYPNIIFDHEHYVDQILLDEYVAKNNTNLQIYNTIVMDVQGYELQVLQGAKNTLLNIDHIITEVNFEHLYENCVLIDELDSFLMNYGLHRLETVNSGAGWGDAFYSKHNQPPTSSYLRNELLHSMINY